MMAVEVNVRDVFMECLIQKIKLLYQHSLVVQVILK